MRHVVDAAADGAAEATIDEIDHERRMHGDRRMDAERRRPRLVAKTRDDFARHAGRLQRQAAAVACGEKALRIEAATRDLEPLDRRVDRPRLALRGGLLAEDQPGLERHPQLDLDAVVGGAAVERKSELEERRDPRRPKRVVRELRDDGRLVGPHVVRQEEAVVQRRAPAHERMAVRRLPEAGDERA